MLVSRMFSTSEDAANAVGELKQVGFREVAIRVIEKTDADVSGVSLLTQGVSEARAHHYAESINQGGTLVIVDAPVGAGTTAKAILERPRSRDSGTPTAEYETSARSRVAAAPPDPATPLSSWLKWPVLSHEAAPLSKWLNFPTLSKPPTSKPTSHGFPFLSANPTPLSSRFGMKVISDNPTPFSSWIGKKTLSDDATPLSTRLGRRVLIDNPTPLSSWLNIPVLSREKSTHSQPQPPSPPPTISQPAIQSPPPTQSRARTKSQPPIEPPPPAEPPSASEP